MLNESRQNISTKESLLFCILSGLFVYFVASIPLILFRLFPPTQPKGIDICFTTIYPPKYEAFIIGFSIFTILGIYLSRKLNIKNRITHFSFLAVVLSIGGGILTSLLEASYYIFWIGDSFDREMFFRRLQENYYETLLYDVQIISWALVFVIAFIPFTSLFLLTTSLISKFKTHNSLK